MGNLDIANPPAHVCAVVDANTVCVANTHSVGTVCTYNMGTMDADNASTVVDNVMCVVASGTSEARVGAGDANVARATGSGTTKTQEGAWTARLAVTVFLLTSPALRGSTWMI